MLANSVVGQRALKTFDFSNEKNSACYDQFFYGHGKLLLTGEYFILDRAQGLALPTVVGQSMGVKYSSSFNPKLTWRSYDVDGQVWFESQFEFWHFNCLDEVTTPEAQFLQKLLIEARKQNKHFLRDEVDTLVETRLGFPLKWGLGSSSTLIYNVAQWAYISPFELAFKTYGGSGYDIACAQSDGPILYKKKGNTPSWSTVNFNPEFKDQLYFIYLEKKQDSRVAIEHFKRKGPFPKQLTQEVNELAQDFMAAKTLEEFEQAIFEHEDLVAKALDLACVKEKLFADYWGQAKSLGAWGGDFIMVTSSRSFEETQNYFKQKGFGTMLKFDELILKTPALLPNQGEHGLVH